MDGLDDDAAAGRGEIVHHRPLPGVSVVLWDVRSTCVWFWSGRYLCNAAIWGGICRDLILLGPRLKTIGSVGRSVLHFYVGPALACSSLSFPAQARSVRSSAHHIAISCTSIPLTSFVRFVYSPNPKQHVFLPHIIFPFRPFRRKRETQIKSQQ